MLTAVVVGIILSLVNCTMALSDKDPTLTPFFSDQEWQAMPKSGEFKFSLIDKDGIRVPRQNGRGLMGVSVGFSNADVRQLQYEAPIFAQQGINHVRLGIRPEDGWGWSDWRKLLPELQRMGLSSAWAHWALCTGHDYYARLLELPEGTVNNCDLVTFEDGTEGHFRGMGTLGNIFSPEFQSVVDRIIDHTARQMGSYSTIIGYQYSNEVQFGTGSYDPYARRSWQRFLKSLFGDATPAADSNGDGVFFNSTFGKTYHTWDEVEQFRGDDWKDRRRVLLRDAWIGLSYARFIDHACQRARRTNPDLLTGAMICVPLSPTVDLSLMLSMPNVSASFINTYFCWLGSGLLMEAIGDTYRKPTIASEINMPQGTYAEVRWGALTHLPYLEGFEWFTYSWLPKSAPGEHGGKYGLVDTWTIDSTKQTSGEFTEPYKVVEYNERFAIIPQLAPFVGRLRSGIDRGILWISASGYPRDWLEDHAETGIMRAHVTSDVALALAPNALDLSRYKVIIYRNLQSPCISRDIYRRLQQFVRDGGTVITGAYFIGSEGTWLGEDNARDWWQGMSLARSSRNEEGVTTVRYGEHEFDMKGTFPYLVSAGPAVVTTGEVEDSTGERYPFVLTRAEGQGKWVYINLPFFFQLTEPFDRHIPEKYAQRFDCLREIIATCSGAAPANRYATQWYEGDECVLAIREPRPGGDESEPGPAQGARWPNGDYVMFEVFDLAAEGGKPFTRVTNGRIQPERDLRPKEARLWVVKPYGEPVVMYADGTLKNGAKLESGVYSKGRLAFEFAQRAFISAPERPVSLTVDGKAHPFTYDAQSKIVKIEREGPPARAELVFGAADK